LVSSGELKVDISRVYPLSQYRDATEALESRKTTGKLVLEIPQ
jgi:NADPH2:quinone reductase